MESRLSARLSALVAASSATEQRRHLQEFVEFFAFDSSFSSLDRDCPGLWGRLALSLLSAARQQLARAFPPSPSAARGRKKPVALVPNDAVAIQKLFHAVETRAASSPASPSSSPEAAFPRGSADREAAHLRSAHSRLGSEQSGLEGGRLDAQEEEDDFFSSPSRSSAVVPVATDETRDGGRPSTCGDRLSRVASDVVKNLLSLLLECAKKRREASQHGRDVARTLSLRLRLLQRACSDRSRRGKRERPWREADSEDDSDDRSHAAPQLWRARDPSDDGVAEEWREADEKWEGCFLSILQQLLRNENYLKELPFPLVKGLLARLLSLSFSSPHKCLSIALSLLSSPSISVAVGSLGRTSLVSLLRLLEGLLHPALLLPGSSASSEFALPPFTAEDARVASAALACLLQLILQLPFLFREQLFLLSTRAQRSGTFPPSSSSWRSNDAPVSEGQDRRCEQEACVRRIGPGESMHFSSVKRERTGVGVDSAAPSQAARNVSFIRLGSAETISRASARTAAYAKGEVGANAGVTAERDGEKALTGATNTTRGGARRDSESDEWGDDETAHGDEPEEPLVMRVLLALLQDDVWSALDETAKWNAVSLARWTLLLARGSAARTVLPSLVGRSGCMRRLFAALLRLLPPYFCALRALTADDAHGFDSAAQPISVEEICHTAAGFDLLRTVETFPGSDEELTVPRQGAKGSLWLMRVVVLDVLRQTIWEAAHHHAALLGYRLPEACAASRFTAPESVEPAYSRTPSLLLLATSDGGFPDEREATVQRGTEGGGMQDTDTACETKWRIKREREEPDDVCAISQYGDKKKRSGEHMSLDSSVASAHDICAADIHNERREAGQLDGGRGDAPSRDSRTYLNNDHAFVKQDKSEGRAEAPAKAWLSRAQVAKRAGVAYILAKLRASKGGIQRQMWSLLVVRFCEGAGSAFSSASSFSLLAPLFDELGDTYLRTLDSLVSVASGRGSEAASSLCGHFVASTQALSSLLALHIYPFLLGSSSTGRECELSQVAAAAPCEARDEDRPSHPWRDARRARLCRPRDGGMATPQEEGDSGRSRSRPFPGSATRFEHERRNFGSQREEKSGAAISRLSEGIHFEPEAGADEYDGWSWRIEVVSSQLLVPASIVSTLKSGDTTAELLWGRGLALGSASGPQSTAYPGRLLQSSLLHAQSVLDCLIQLQRQLSSAAPVESADSSSLTFSPLFVFSSFARLVHLLLLLLPPAETREAVELLLSPPFLPSRGALLAFLSSAAAPGRRTKAVPPGTGGLGALLPSGGLFSASLFPPSPWLFELLSVAFLRHADTIPTAVIDTLLRYLLPHVITASSATTFEGARGDRGRKESRDGGDSGRSRAANWEIRRPQPPERRAASTRHPLMTLWMPSVFARPLSSSSSRACTAWGCLFSLSLTALFPQLLRNMGLAKHLPHTLPGVSAGAPPSHNLPETTACLSFTFRSRSPYRGIAEPSGDSQRLVHGRAKPSSQSRFCDLVFFRSSCPSVSPLLLPSSHMRYEGSLSDARGAGAACSLLFVASSLVSQRHRTGSISWHLSGSGSQGSHAAECELEQVLSGGVNADDVCVPLASSCNSLVPTQAYAACFQTSVPLVCQLLSVSGLCRTASSSGAWDSSVLESSPRASHFLASALDASGGVATSLAGSGRSLWESEYRLHDVSSLLRFLPLPLSPAPPLLSITPSSAICLVTASPSSLGLLPFERERGSVLSPRAATGAVSEAGSAYADRARATVCCGEVFGVPLATETASLSSGFSENLIHIFYQTHTQCTLSFLSLFRVRQCRPPGSCRRSAPCGSRGGPSLTASSLSGAASRGSFDASPSECTCCACSFIDPWACVGLRAGVKVSLAVAAASQFLCSLRIASLVLPAELWVAALPGDLRTAFPALRLPRPAPAPANALHTRSRRSGRTPKNFEDSDSCVVPQSRSRGSSLPPWSSPGEEANVDATESEHEGWLPPGDSAKLGGVCRRRGDLAKAEPGLGARPSRGCNWRPLAPCSAGCATWLAVDACLCLLTQSCDARRRSTSRARSPRPRPTAASLGIGVAASSTLCSRAEPGVRCASVSQRQRRALSSGGGVSTHARPLRQPQDLYSDDPGWDPEGAPRHARRQASAHVDSFNGLGEFSNGLNDGVECRDSFASPQEIARTNETLERVEAACRGRGRSELCQPLERSAGEGLAGEGDSNEEDDGAAEAGSFDRDRRGDSRRERGPGAACASQVEVLWKTWTEVFSLLQLHGLPCPTACFGCDLGTLSSAFKVFRNSDRGIRQQRQSHRMHRNGRSVEGIVARGADPSDAQRGRTSRGHPRGAVGRRKDGEAEADANSCSLSPFFLHVQRPVCAAGVTSNKSDDAQGATEVADVKASEQTPSQREAAVATSKAGAFGQCAEIPAADGAAYWRLYTLSTSPRLLCLHLHLLHTLVVTSRCVKGGGRFSTLTQHAFFLGSAQGLLQSPRTVSGRDGATRPEETDPENWDQRATTGNGFEGVSRGRDADARPFVSTGGGRQKAGESRLWGYEVPGEGEGGGRFAGGGGYSLFPSCSSILRLLLSSLSAFTVAGPSARGAFCPCSALQTCERCDEPRGEQLSCAALSQPERGALAFISLRHRRLWAVCVEFLDAFANEAPAHDKHFVASARDPPSRRSSTDSIADDASPSLSTLCDRPPAARHFCAKPQAAAMTHESERGFESAHARYPSSGSPWRPLEVVWAQGGGAAVFYDLFENLALHSEALCSGEVSECGAEDDLQVEHRCQKLLLVLEGVASLIRAETPLVLLQPVFLSWLVSCLARVVAVGSPSAAASVASILLSVCQGLRRIVEALQDTETLESTDVSSESSPSSTSWRDSCSLQATHTLNGALCSAFFIPIDSDDDAIAHRFAPHLCRVGRSSPVAMFLEKVREAKSVLTGVVEILSDRLPVFVEDDQRRDPDGLSYLGQLVAELLALGRREQAAVGKDVVDVLAALVVDRNAPLLLWRDSEDDELQPTESSGATADQQARMAHAEGGDKAEEGAARTYKSKVWMLSTEVQRASEMQAGTQALHDDDQKLLRENQESADDSMLAELALRLAPSTVGVLLEAFEASEVSSDLFKPVYRLLVSHVRRWGAYTRRHLLPELGRASDSSWRACAAADHAPRASPPLLSSALAQSASSCPFLASSGDGGGPPQSLRSIPFLARHLRLQHQLVAQSHTCKEWRVGYLPTRDLVALLALSAACVAVPSLTADVLWVLLQGVAPRRDSLLHGSFCGFPSRGSRASLEARHRSSAPPVSASPAGGSSQCGDDLQGHEQGDTVPCPTEGERYDGEAAGERKEPGRYIVARPHHDARELRSSSLQAVEESLLRLSSPLTHAILYALSVIAHRQKRSSSREMCLDYVPYFLIQWVSLAVKQDAERRAAAHDMEPYPAASRLAPASGAGTGKRGPRAGVESEPFFDAEDDGEWLPLTSRGDTGEADECIDIGNGRWRTAFWPWSSLASLTSSSCSTGASPREASEGRDAYASRVALLESGVGGTCMRLGMAHMKVEATDKGHTGSTLAGRTLSTSARRFLRSHAELLLGACFVCGMDPGEAADFVQSVAGFSSDERRRFLRARGSLLRAGSLLVRGLRASSLSAQISSSSVSAASPTSSRSPDIATLHRCASDGYLLPSVARIILTFADIAASSPLSFFTVCESLAEASAGQFARYTSRSGGAVVSAGSRSGASRNSFPALSVLQGTQGRTTDSRNETIDAECASGARASDVPAEAFERHFVVLMLSLEHLLRPHTVGSEARLGRSAAADSSVPRASCRSPSSPFWAVSATGSLVGSLFSSSFSSTQAPATSEGNGVTEAAGRTSRLASFMSLERLQTRFRLVLEVSAAVLPCAVSSASRLHAFLCLMFRLLSPLLCSSAAPSWKRNIASSSPSASSDSFVSVTAASPSSCAAVTASARDVRSTPPAYLLTRAVLDSRDARGGGELAWRRPRWALQAEEDENRKFVQLLLTTTLTVIAAAPSETLRKALCLTAGRLATATPCSATGASRALRGTLSSPLLDILADALVEKYADPAALLASLSSAQTRLPPGGSVSIAAASPSSASAPPCGIKLAETRRDGIMSPRSDQQNKVAHLNPSGDGPRGASARRQQCEAGEEQAASSLLSSCPVFILLSALLVRVSGGRGAFCDASVSADIVRRAFTPSASSLRESEARHQSAAAAGNGERKLNTGGLGRAETTAALVVEQLGLPIASLFSLRVLLRKGARRALDLLASVVASALTGGCKGAQTLSAAPRTASPIAARLTRIACLLPFASLADWLDTCTVEGLFLPLLGCASSPFPASHLGAQGKRAGVSDESRAAPKTSNAPTRCQRRTSDGPVSFPRETGGELGRPVGDAETEAGAGACISREQTEELVERYLALQAPHPDLDFGWACEPKDAEECGDEEKLEQKPRRSESLLVAAVERNIEAAGAKASADEFLHARAFPPFLADAREDARACSSLAAAADELVSVFLLSEATTAKRLLLGLASLHLGRTRMPTQKNTQAIGALPEPNAPADAPSQGHPCASQYSAPMGDAPSGAARPTRPAFAGPNPPFQRLCKNEHEEGDAERAKHLSPNSVKAHLLLYVCGERRLNHAWRRLASLLLLNLPPTNLTNLRDTLPAQDSRYERCLTGAAASHRLLVLLLSVFDPFAEGQRARKETRSQTRRVFEGTQPEPREGKERQHVQPVLMLTVLGLVGACATLCDPEAVHALRLMALIALQNLSGSAAQRRERLSSRVQSLRPPGGAPPLERHGGGRRAGVSSDGYEASDGEGTDREEAEEAEEAEGDGEVEDVDRLRTLLAGASPFMALLSGTAGDIYRERDSCSLLNLACARIAVSIGAIPPQWSSSPASQPPPVSPSRFFRQTAGTWRPAAPSGVAWTPPGPAAAGCSSSGCAQTGESGHVPWAMRVAAALLLFLDKVAKGEIEGTDLEETCDDETEGAEATKSSLSAGVERPEEASERSVHYPPSPPPNFVQVPPAESRRTLFGCWAPFAFVCPTFAEHALPLLFLCMLQTTSDACRHLAAALNRCIFQPLSSRVPLLSQSFSASDMELSKHLFGPSVVGSSAPSNSKDTVDNRGVSSCWSCDVPSSTVSPSGEAFAAAALCVKALQFVRVYVSRLAGGAAPGVLRSRLKRRGDARGAKSRKTPEGDSGERKTLVEPVGLAPCRATARGTGERPVSTKEHAKEAGAHGKATGVDERQVEATRGTTGDAGCTVSDAAAASRQAVPPVVDLSKLTSGGCLQRRRASRGRAEDAGRKEERIAEGPVEQRGSGKPSAPSTAKGRNPRDFFRRTGDPTESDAADPASHAPPQEAEACRTVLDGGRSPPDASQAHAHAPTSSAASLSRSSAGCRLLREGLGGDMLENFLHLWAALDLQAIAFVALRLGCPTDALFFAEQEIERVCPDAGLEEGLSRISQQFQRCQWDRMPQIHAAQALREMLLSSSSERRNREAVDGGQGSRADVPASDTAPDGDKGGHGAERGNAVGGSRVPARLRGGAEIADTRNEQPKTRTLGDRALTVNPPGTAEITEERMRRFHLSLQRLRELSVRPANASALLTPVSPPPLFLLVSQALIDADEEDLSAVTDCLSAWHTSNFLIQRMQAEHDWLATLTLQQEQLQHLEASRVRLLAQQKRSLSAVERFSTGTTSGPRSRHITGVRDFDTASYAACRSAFITEGDTCLQARLQDIEQLLYSVKSQMASTLGRIGLHSLRASVLESLQQPLHVSSLAYSAPSEYSSFPDYAASRSSFHTPGECRVAWKLAAGAGRTRLDSPLSPEPARGSSAGGGWDGLDPSSASWLERKFECLWRLHRWDADAATPDDSCRLPDACINAPNLEGVWASSLFAEPQGMALTSAHSKSCMGQQSAHLGLFNGCIYSTLSLVHAAAACQPSALIPGWPSHALASSSRPPIPAVLDAPAAASLRDVPCLSPRGGGRQRADESRGRSDRTTVWCAGGLVEDPEVQPNLGLQNMMTRLRAVQISRHALTLALQRLEGALNSADARLSLRETPTETRGQSLSRRLVGAYIELAMAQALQQAADLSLRQALTDPLQQSCSDESAFEELQAGWESQLAVSAGTLFASSSSACYSSRYSLPFFLEPLVSLQTSILEAAIPSVHSPQCRPSAVPFALDCQGHSFHRQLTADGNIEDWNVRELVHSGRHHSQHGTDAELMCGCHVRRSAARHLLLLGEMKRERGDWRGSLEHLLQAKTHLLQLQTDLALPVWKKLPALLDDWREASLFELPSVVSSPMASPPLPAPPSSSPLVPPSTAVPPSLSSLMSPSLACPGLCDQDLACFAPSFVCIDLFLVQWQLAKTLYLSGDCSGSLSIASRLCQPKNWPLLPFQRSTTSCVPSSFSSSPVAAAAALVAPLQCGGRCPDASPASFRAAHQTASFLNGSRILAFGAYRQIKRERKAEVELQKFRRAIIDALCSCGDWQFRGRWATEATVRRQYFNIALRLGPLAGSLEPSQRLATLIDDQLQSYSDYRHSVPSLVKADLRRQERAEIEGLLQQLSAVFGGREEGDKPRRMQAQQKLLQQHVCMLQQKQRAMEREREREHRERTQWALEAVRLYAACLRDPFLPHAAKTTSRLLSLWFEWGEAVPEMNAALDTILISPFASSSDSGSQSRKVMSAVAANEQPAKPDDEPPSAGPPDLRHLLPFVYQIASRLGSPADSPFQRTLRALLLAMAKQYPFQCLYQLVAIRNGRRIPPGHRGSDRFTVQQDKINAAQDVLNRLADTSRPLKLVVTAVEALVDFYNDLCLLDFDDDLREAQKQQRNLRLLQRGTAASLSRPLTPQEQMLRLPSFKRLEEFASMLPVPTVEHPRDALVPFQPPSALLRLQGSADFLRGLSTYIYSLHPCCLSAGPGDPLRMQVKSIGSGITKPKLLCVWDRRGRKHKQCCKGREDVRQDRVAQQLFGMINQVFLEAPSTVENNFYLRTYAVVPFSPAVGILEWVNDTVTLAQYLIGGPENSYHGAHARYRPQDWPFTACRHRLRQAREKALAHARQLASRGTGGEVEGENADKKPTPPAPDGGEGNLVESLVRTYDEICGRFKPVLHFFFLEHFPSADVWYEKQQHYRRTLAVSSMVSYILGLGDRHTNNILLDVASGDIVHIDFGIMFEQGKLLAIPELVPFRLTRDLVDGLGCLGVAGCFKRDCETTMEVLRRVSPLVVSIVEVLLFDPLYRWCLDARRLLQDNEKSLPLASSSRPDVSAKRGRGKGAVAASGRGKRPAFIAAFSTSGPNAKKRSREEAVLLSSHGASVARCGNEAERQDREDADGREEESKLKPEERDTPIVEDILTKAEGNLNAKRAVLTVRRKLDGYEEGEIAQLSVTAHVARLLNAAQDRTALAQMFVGWAPWV
ncbi:hypothetical protein BESB_004930 [Besnoitia besnoiti]|uniref:non-specific serine/threonine protein kinase n=1 Tax=Besnoitia besnoiti TaxID=94643 RepID=A0A2A9MQA6_BESBE|nr:hypothetical protein BESB_004930 [Besnoitia besnoiti]PFH38152.1 hypothetical protein BESB_004930 [Besnoitia besnoiti]